MIDIIIVGLVLLSLLICIIQDKIKEKFDKEKAEEIIVFIWFLPIILFCVYIALKEVGV